MISTVYVGTYTEAASQGIYAFKFETSHNPDVPQLTPLGLVAQTPNPSFLEIDRHRRLLFAVNEIDNFEGKSSGAVSAFRIEPSGKLTFLNQKSSRGAGPCRLVLDKSARHLLVANYNDGTAAVLPVAPDGRLGDATDFMQHSGRGTRPKRQTGPHAHSVTMSPDNRFAFVCDLGIDKVMVYRFDVGKGKLAFHDPAFVSLQPGAGPRHLTFRPDGRFAYVINELDSTVTAFVYDANSGVLKELETVSTLPRDYDGPNITAEIEVHPSGKYLYVSNRGHNSIVTLHIDAQKGTLTWLEELSTNGKTPRHFGIDAGGNYLVVANQDSDGVLMMRIDPASGRLEPAADPVRVSMPTCARFLEPT